MMLIVRNRQTTTGYGLIGYHNDIFEVQRWEWRDAESFTNKFSRATGQNYTSLIETHDEDLEIAVLRAN